VGNDIAIASNCWIYPVSDGTNGGSVYFTARNVTINAGGGFNANGWGYEGGSSNGFGPGGAIATVIGGNYGSGGGYGGKGGKGYRGTGGAAYPWTNAPLLPGSGGGNNGLSGGGLIWIKASDTFVLDGVIQANGKGGTSSSPYYYYAGGSGGGILIIVAKKFRGAASGQLSAYGGQGGFVDTVNNGGGGGGGRIAVWHRISEADQQAILADPDNALANVPRLVIATNFDGTYFSGSFTATNGWCYRGGAETGTVVYLTVPPPKGTIFSVR
ncbi:MAG: hypothetical protein PHW60_15455, partial [Kiritimatiellae bacterium]|nr:hypothetical protein [Kiritimatiellia bacterium]